MEKLVLAPVVQHWLWQNQHSPIKKRQTRIKTASYLAKLKLLLVHFSNTESNLSAIKVQNTSVILSQFKKICEYLIDFQ